MQGIVTGRISFFLTAILAAGFGLSGAFAAPDTRSERGSPKQGAAASPMGQTSVPLPSRSLIDDPFERMQRKEGFGTTNADQYQKCLDLIVVDASEAFEAGSVWRDQGGGAPARHCIALALMELGHYGEGATRLEKLASDPGAGSTSLRMQILSQAGNGWLLEGQARRAIAAFSSGINLGKEDKRVATTTLMFDRARSYSLIDQWGPAFQDLTEVLAINPRNLSALILRMQFTVW